MRLSPSPRMGQRLESGQRRNVADLVAVQMQSIEFGQTLKGRDSLRSCC